MKFIKKQRDSLAKLLYDFARYTFAGIILGQIVAGEKFKLWILIVGILIAVIFPILGLIIEGRKE